MFNQPYVDSNFIFVFNGLLKGVRIPEKVRGTIGAEKIWFLLKDLLKTMKPQESLNELKDYLLKHTRYVQALNIGLADKDNIYALCFYDRFPKYYQLHYSVNKERDIVCSEELLLDHWNIMKRSQVTKL
ncbi:hypothetical protein HYW87_03400 [Candidatus Roizmanbacteria bacterium]|nr:hypothetical protein [Candidatus Roizmanbacteria bacterium]